MWRVTKPVLGNILGLAKRPAAVACRASTPALLLTVAWLGWDALGPDRPALSSECQALVAEVTPNIIEDLAAARGDTRIVRFVAIARDHTDGVTVHLRDAIEESNVLILEDRSFGEKLRNLIGLRQRPPVLESALEDAGDDGVDAVLSATLHRLDHFGSRAGLELQVQLHRTEGGARLLDRRYHAGPTAPGSTAPGPTRGVTTVGNSSTPHPAERRWLAWVLSTLLLPLFTAGFLVAVVQQRSNRTNAFTLALYTAAGGLLFYWLVGASYELPESRWGMTAGAVAVVALYNLGILSWLAPSPYLAEENV